MKYIWFISPWTQINDSKQGVILHMIQNKCKMLNCGFGQKETNMADEEDMKLKTWNSHI